MLVYPRTHQIWVWLSVWHSSHLSCCCSRNWDSWAGEQDSEDVPRGENLLDNTLQASLEQEYVSSLWGEKLITAFIGSFHCLLSSLQFLCTALMWQLLSSAPIFCGRYWKCSGKCIENMLPYVAAWPANCQVDNWVCVQASLWNCTRNLSGSWSMASRRDPVYGGLGSDWTQKLKLGALDHGWICNSIFYLQLYMFQITQFVVTNDT